MSIFNDKIIKSVAEAAAKIMEASKEGSHPKTEKEKELAAMGHPKDKITHKDVLIGRGVLKKEEKESCEDEVKEHEKKMHGKKGEVSKHEKEMHKESFIDILESYKKDGLKVIAKMRKEEVDNETFTKEVEDQKKSMEGKKKQPSVAAPATQGVKQMREEEEIDESMTKSPTSLMPGYDERAARFMARQAKGTLVKGSAQSAKQKEGGMKPKKEMKKEEFDLDEDINQLDEISPGLAARAASAASDPDYQGRASSSNIAKMATKKFGKKIGGQISDVAKGHYPKEYGKDKETVPLGSRDRLKYRQNRSTSPTMTTKDGKLTKTAQKGLKSDLKSEEVDLDERTLTEPEKKKKEEYVLSMKKKMPGFKERYGERAKSVLYATATKMAKKD
jgi:hypothetical protein